MKTWHWAAIILTCVFVLLALPYVISGDAEFAGADGQAGQVITDVNPDYVPWFKPLWKPAPETETMIFSLQAAIGAGLLAFGFGYWVGRRKGSEQSAGNQSGTGAQTDARLTAAPGDS